MLAFFQPKEDIPNSFQDSVFLLPLVQRIKRDKFAGLLVSPSVAYPGTYERVGYLSSETTKAEDRAKMEPVYQMLRDKSLKQKVILV